jgi:hypothetical protein
MRDLNAVIGQMKHRLRPSKTLPIPWRSIGNPPMILHGAQLALGWFITATHNSLIQARP